MTKLNIDTRVNILNTLIESIVTAAKPAVLLQNDKDFQDRIAEVLQAHSDALRDLTERRTIGFLGGKPCLK